MRQLNIIFIFCFAIIVQENLAHAQHARFIAAKSASAIDAISNITSIADYTLTGNEILKKVGNGLQILDGAIIKSTLQLLSSTVYIMIPLAEGGLLLRAVNEGDFGCALYRSGKIGLYFYSLPLYQAATYLESIKNAYDLYKQILSAQQQLKDHLSEFPKEAKCVLY